MNDSSPPPPLRPAPASGEPAARDTGTQAVDVVVIGAGPAGEVAAGRCAEHGLSVVVVERELVGGECSYWGCIPSKALLRPGDVIAAARRVPGAACGVPICGSGGCWGRRWSRGSGGSGTRCFGKPSWATSSSAGGQSLRDRRSRVVGGASVSRS
jgi:choline dehydrogenase-like flavoprotein